MKEITEAINLESDLLLKLTPLSETEIFEFMKNLRGGTYFNMGMYSSIPVSKAYKSTIRIYKVIDLTAIVSGVSYENVGTTKEFRDRTGEAPGKSWYDHTPGFENKIGQKKSDPNSKYVLWDIKRGTGTCVRYYVVDIDTGAVTPVSKADVENSPYLTASEKAKLTPRPVEGFDKTTGQLIENKTIWRTAAFDHIFWLSQAGQATQEYGTRFEEDFGLTEAFGNELFVDAHAYVHTDLDAILSGKVVESVEKSLNEEADIFMDAHAGAKTKLDDVLSGVMSEDLVDNDEEDYAVTYRVKSWPKNKSTTVEFTASSKEEALDTFWEYVLDPESYDEGEPVLSESDFEILDLKGTSSCDECYKTKNLKESYRRTTSRGSSLVDNELFVDFD